MNEAKGLGSLLACDMMTCRAITLSALSMHFGILFWEAVKDEHPPRTVIRYTSHSRHSPLFVASWSFMSWEGNVIMVLYVGQHPRINAEEEEMKRDVSQVLLLMDWLYETICRLVCLSLVNAICGETTDSVLDA